MKEGKGSVFTPCVSPPYVQLSAPCLSADLILLHVLKWNDEKCRQWRALVISCGFIIFSSLTFKWEIFNLFKFEFIYFRSQKKSECTEERHLYSHKNCFETSNTRVIIRSLKYIFQPSSSKCEMAMLPKCFIMYLFTYVK